MKRDPIVQKNRVEYAVDQLTHEYDIDVTFQNDNEIRFYHKGYEVKFFPYTGWASGKSIKDGRGLQNLLKQLRN